MADSSSLWIKICGLRDVETAVQVAELGADAIGINFFTGSPRCVDDLATAAQILQALPETTTAVGVFVNHPAAEIREICQATGLRTVQLHGDESNTLIGELAEFRVIRALRFSQDGLSMHASKGRTGERGRRSIGRGSRRNSAKTRGRR